MQCGSCRIKLPARAIHCPACGTITPNAIAKFGISPHERTVPSLARRPVKIGFVILVPVLLTGGIFFFFVYQSPRAVAKVSNSSNQIPANAPIRLDGSDSSDPNGKPLTYLWMQTAGSTVALSNPTTAQPTFRSPASAASLTFQLVVSNGQSNSSPASVIITVHNRTSLAPYAKAIASSQNMRTSQTADKAIDGEINGFLDDPTGDPTKEWATNGGKAGSWLKLTWNSPQTVNNVVLYDRPNFSDQITSGNIQFSDGSSVSFRSLNNDGFATSITFQTKAITSLQLNITLVRDSTLNVGLSEIQVYFL